MMSEINALPDSSCTSLPEIPGGWATKDIVVLEKKFRVTLPADPDAFLDDPNVSAIHQHDEYMPYWAYLWPAATAMAEFVTANKRRLDRNVLEIGSGIGLVGLAALPCGLNVTFSDYEPLAVKLSLDNARRNGFADAEGIVLDWRHPLNRLFPVILGCEILYERRNHEPILNLIGSMLTRGGECWIGDGGREHAGEFIECAKQQGWAVKLLDSQGRPLSEPQRGRFQLLILKRSERMSDC